MPPMSRSRLGLSDAGSGADDAAAIVDVADVDLRAFLESEIRSARLTPGEGRELLLETLPGWAEPYENASATVAADLYEQKRFAYGIDAVVPYRPSLAPRVDAARWGILASWALAPVVEEVDWRCGVPEDRRRCASDDC